MFVVALSSHKIAVFLRRQLKFERSGVENRHAFHDVGAAAANMAMQATALGLFIHQMAGFDVPKARSVYSIPEDYEPVTAIALGYLGDPQIRARKISSKRTLTWYSQTLSKFCLLW